MKVISEHNIDLKNKIKTSDIIKESGYNEVNFLISEGVNNGKIPKELEPFYSKVAVLVQFENSVSSSEVLSAASRLKLIRPSYGESFVFGSQHPDEQRSSKIICLHSLQYYWGGGLFNLALDCNKKGRKVSLISSGGVWSNQCKFIFIKDI